MVIPSWKTFFANRQARNERQKARETNKERQVRESREKNPPTKRTKVFLWTRMENGEYRRESFYQAENGMHLDSYGENQKIYDAFSNEWDCCYKFGESTKDERIYNENDDDDEYMMPPPSAAALDRELEPDILLADDTQSASTVEERRPFSVVGPVDIPFDWEDFETSQLMYQFYGFVAPLPLPTRPSSINSKGRSTFSTITGLHRVDSKFFESPVASFTLEFLKSLITSKTPKNTTWDIATGNRMSVSGSKLFRRMHAVECGNVRWYVFDYKEAATMPWMVAVPRVIDAFYICRLDPTGASDLTDFEVARDLLNHGIQFSTLLPVKPLPCSVTPPITVPVRLAGYKFTRDDYYAYEQQRAALLSNPRIARSALLRGGIVWRLAVATLSFDDVLEGPTTAATLQRQGIIIKTGDESVDLCDDGLSTLELDLICGLHHCHTGLSYLYFSFIL